MISKKVRFLSCITYFLLYCKLFKQVSCVNEEQFPDPQDFFVAKDHVREQIFELPDMTNDPIYFTTDRSTADRILKFFPLFARQQPSRDLDQQAYLKSRNSVSKGIFVMPITTKTQKPFVNERKIIFSPQKIPTLLIRQQSLNAPNQQIMITGEYMDRKHLPRMSKTASYKNLYVNDKITADGLQSPFLLSDHDHKIQSLNQQNFAEMKETDQKIFPDVADTVKIQRAFLFPKNVEGQLRKIPLAFLYQATPRVLKQQEMVTVKGDGDWEHRFYTSDKTGNQAFSNTNVSVTNSTAVIYQQLPRHLKQQDLLMGKDKDAKDTFHVPSARATQRLLTSTNRNKKSFQKLLSLLKTPQTTFKYQNMPPLPQQQNLVAEKDIDGETFFKAPDNEMAQTRFTINKNADLLRNLFPLSGYEQQHQQNFIMEKYASTMHSSDVTRTEKPFLADKNVTDSLPSVLSSFAHQQSSQESMKEYSFVAVKNEYTENFIDGSENLTTQLPFIDKINRTRKVASLIAPEQPLFVEPQTSPRTSDGQDHVTVKNAGVTLEGTDWDKIFSIFINVICGILIVICLVLTYFTCKRKSRNASKANHNSKPQIFSKTDKQECKNKNNDSSTLLEEKIEELTSEQFEDYELNKYAIAPAFAYYAKPSTFSLKDL